MWEFTKIQLNGRSPMQEILSRCTNVLNLRLVIYNLSENRVECATVHPHEAQSFTLSREVVSKIKQQTCGNGFAILAYDVCGKRVYLVECTPEVNAASAVLLCVVTELMGGHIEAPNGRHPNPVYEYEGECDCCDDDEDDWLDEDDDEDDEPPFFREPRPIVGGPFGRGMKAPIPDFVRRDERGRFLPKNPNCGCTSINDEGLTHRRFRLGGRR